jgi:hypothetical protein
MNQGFPGVAARTARRLGVFPAFAAPNAAESVSRTSHNTTLCSLPAGRQAPRRAAGAGLASRGVAPGRPPAVIGRL